MNDETNKMINDVMLVTLKWD